MNRRLVLLAVVMLSAGCASSPTGTAAQAVAPPVVADAQVSTTVVFEDPSSTLLGDPGGTSVTADPVRTPGVADPRVTQANIGTTICHAGYTATVRPSSRVTTKLKIAQLAADPRYIDHNPAHYEEDHAISLELGGAPADPLNLWPEAHVRSLKVDAEENRLHAAVCRGTMTLATGQAEIMRIKATLG